MTLSGFHLAEGIADMQASPFDAPHVSSLDLSLVVHHQASCLPSTREPAAKARALLAQRGVIGLARQVLDVDGFAVWREHAVSIQAAIYRLDHHYEVSRVIEWRKEAPLWWDIQLRLAQVPQGSGDLWDAFESLRSYADVERRIHCADPIDSREFEGLLIQKCADVRIARSLAWALGCRLPSRWEIAFWNVYDQCWEIIEDFVDIREDGQDWNFNFWLYAAMARLRSVGVLETVQDLLKGRLSDLEQLRRRLPICASTRCGPALEVTQRAVAGMGNPATHVSRAVASGRVWRFGGSPLLEKPAQIGSRASAVLHCVGVLGQHL